MRLAGPERELVKKSRIGRGWGMRPGFPASPSWKQLEGVFR
jgi:hypothetical protein